MRMSFAVDVLTEAAAERHDVDDVAGRLHARLVDLDGDRQQQLQFIRTEIAVGETVISLAPPLSIPVETPTKGRGGCSSCSSFAQQGSGGLGCDSEWLRRHEATQAAPSVFGG